MHEHGGHYRAHRYGHRDHFGPTHYHGALEYRECIANDVPKGKLTSFPFAVKLKPSEVVWFSFIVYRNRKHRDRVNAKVMKDPRLAKYMNPKAMPLDGKRVIFGGFEVVVSH